MHKARKENRKGKRREGRKEKDERRNKERVTTSTAPTYPNPHNHLSLLPFFHCFFNQTLPAMFRVTGCFMRLVCDVIIKFYWLFVED